MMRQPIDVEAVTEYIRVQVPAIKIPLKFKQFSHGQSNPTYEITSSTGEKYVLRKRPPGDMLANSAHRIDREYEILRALEQTDVPVPKAYALCEDTSIIGTSFYIMEFLDGRIFEDPWLPDHSREERNAIWAEAVKTLGKLHNVDISAVGLNAWRRSSPYYSRQVRALDRVAVAQAQRKDLKTGIEVGKFPYYDELVSFFTDTTTQPADRNTLVHGDFKLDNLVFHKTEARVIGILDWEMASVGHPVSDLVNLTAPYSWSTESVPMLIQFSLTEELKMVQQNFNAGVVPGIPRIETCYAWYQSLTSWNAKAHIDWAVAFNFFRTAVIMQGIASRLSRGQASGVKAKEFALQTLPYALWSHAKVESLKARAKAPSKL